MNQTAVENSDEIDLVRLFSIVWSGKWIILLMVLVCGLLAGYWAFQQGPVYKSEILLIPAQQDGGSNLGGQFGGLAALAGINIGGVGENNVEEGLAVLISRHFIADFVEKNNLTKVLFADEWDAGKKKWRDKTVWYSGDIVSLEPSEGDVIDRFLELVSISQDKKTGLIKLKVEWLEPSLASYWANSLVEELNMYMKSIAIEQSEKSLQYLQGELQKTSILEVRQAIFQIMEGHIKNKTIANVGGEYLFRVIDPAVPAERPFKPNKKLIVLLGVLLGLFLGCLAIFIARLVRSVRNSNNQVNTL